LFTGLDPTHLSDDRDLRTGYRENLNSLRDGVRHAALDWEIIELGRAVEEYLGTVGVARKREFDGDGRGVLSFDWSGGDGHGGCGGGTNGREDEEGDEREEGHEHGEARIRDFVKV
jgi:hypothetical protein